MLSDDQLIEAVDLYKQLNNQKACADKLGITQGAFCQRLKLARGRGYSPQHDMDNLSPDGFAVTGVSTLYDKQTGEAKVQWVKTSREREQAEHNMIAVAEAMAVKIPRVEPTPPPKQTHEKLCNEYIITDYHYGMLAWAKEGGADWDTKIAGDMLWKAFKRMVDDSPDAATAVISQLGDFFHSDSMTPVTEAHGHILDQDGRISKIIAEATTVFRRVVDYALQKHDTVHVVLAEGNHDPYSSIWFRVMFLALYENEPRLTVNDSEIPYYVYQHGNVMLAYHHGHKKNMASLPLFFAAQYPVVWGSTTYRYVGTGHKHSHQSSEHSGMIAIQYQTFASRDAYAARGGWLSERSMTSNTYHVEFGKVATNIFRPEMFDE